MIHPHTEIKQISENIGVGVLATRLIPEGTIVFALDPLDIVLEPTNPIVMDPRHAAYVERYSFRDEKGRRVLSADHAKYVNHHCNPSTMSTAWGFDIAVRDIQPGEELTCEYGLLNIEEPMACDCGDPACRKTIDPNDYLVMGKTWNQRIRKAMKNFSQVEQPLMFLLSPEVLRQAQDFAAKGTGYKKVENMVFHGLPSQNGVHHHVSR